MKTMKFAIDENGTTVDVPCFCGLPVVGEAPIPKYQGLILANWDGCALRVITRSMYPGAKGLLESVFECHPEWFEPRDKGAFPVYGWNSGGIIFACGVYQEFPESQSALERVKHFLVKRCTHVGHDV
jgi:hypothetical protein